MLWVAHGISLTSGIGVLCALIWRPRLPVHWWTLAFLTVALAWDMLGWWMAAHGRPNHWLMNLWPPVAAALILPLLSSAASPRHQDALWVALVVFLGFWGLWTFSGWRPGSGLDDLTHPVGALILASAALSVLVAQGRDARLPFWRRAATWAAAGLFLGHLVDVVAWVALKAALPEPGQAAALWTVRNVLWCGCNLMLGWSFRWA